MGDTTANGAHDAQRTAVPMATADSLPDSFWRGFVQGLVPLLALVVAVTLTLAVTVALSELSARQSFALQQTATAFALGIGLALSLVAYVIAWALALRCVGVWRRASAHASAAGMLWALAITALLVAVPVVAALVAPQHPAP